VNPAEWLKRAALLTPAAPALLSGATCVADYAEFARRAGSIGAALRDRFGVTKNSRVAIFMTNRTQYLEALYGVWFTGAAVVPINAKLHPREAAWIIENADCQVALVSDALGEGLDAVGPAGLDHVISANSSAWRDMYATVPMAAPVPMDNDDLLWLFYTSGTTGRPKGVMLNCGNLLTMTLGYFCDVDPVSQSDCILYAAPMSHGAGIYNFMFVLRGARHVVPLSGRFQPGEILALADEIDGITMFAAPTMVRRLVEGAKASQTSGGGLKTIIYGGGPMYLADIIEATEVMGPRFVQIYGQGECPMAITSLHRDQVADRTHPRWRSRLGSVGTAQSSVMVRIAGADGQTLATGEIGEILVSGPSVMPGYWRNPEATASALKDGWLWSGDMGAMDADGFVTLHDRSKDMIISGGSNIYPREVEEVLLQLPGVSEVSVVGQHDAEWGEIVVAFVVAAKGATLTKTALDTQCVENIARFKRPKDYHFVAQLPKNNYGKVLKTELRARLASGP